MKTKLLRNATAMAAISSSALFVSVPHANAAPTSTQSQSQQGKTCPASKNSSDEKSTTLNKISTSQGQEQISSVEKSIKDGSLVTHASLNDIQFDGAKVYDLNTSDNQTYKVVSLPVSGDYSYTSNITAFFNSSGDRVTYSEALVSKDAENKFQITTYRDGALNKTQSTDIAYQPDSQLKDTSSDKAHPEGFGDKVTCVSGVLGVSGVVARLIVAACAGACATAEDGFSAPFCAACIGAYATIGNGSISKVADCLK